MSNLILKTLNGIKTTNPPIWFMRQAGRHLPEYLAVRKTTKNFIDFCFNPKKAADVTLQPIKRYDMDAAILFADILLIPIGFGVSVKFEKNIGPIVDVLDKKSIRDLNPNNVSERISPVYETISRVKEKLNQDKALIGFCGGPWTVATYMLEGRSTANKEIAKRFAYENPDEIQHLLECLAYASADYLIKQAQAGADILKIFESWAEGLSPFQFETLIIKPTQIIINRVRAAGINVPIIGFPRGGGSKVLDYAKSTNIECLALGTDTSLSWVRSELGDNIVLQGNLDPLALRIGGIVLEKAVDRVLNDAKGLFIFNLGHGVAPDVKIENIHAVINHIRTGHKNYV